MFLSKDETYGDISPIRLNSNGISAFVFIVEVGILCAPFVLCHSLEVERSRDPKSILKEIEDLKCKGYKEVTLRQNVDSYLWYGGGLKDFKGFHHS